MGLYDELGQVLHGHNVAICTLNIRLPDGTHACPPAIVFEQLLESVILALRHDSPTFNEARFRRIVLLGKGC